MKYALVNGQRIEAQPYLSGECPGCGGPMVARCGEKKVWHWAHVGRRICDPWWENETEWHRTWKSYFPSEWQERIHFASDGEKHIADVKTDKEWVLEFQHSHIKPEERRARNSFYKKKIIWVVDGNRRPRYKSQFFKNLEEERPIHSNPTVLKVYLAFSHLLEEWVGDAPVFFDFGEESPMWCLVPTRDDMWVYVAEISRNQFVDLHRNPALDFAEAMGRLINLVSDYENRRTQSLNQSIPQLPSHLQRHLFQQARARSIKRL